MKSFVKAVLASVFVVFLLSQNSFSEPVKYNIDPAQTQGIFKVKHFGISTVSGRFDSFEGSYVFDNEDLNRSSVNAKIDAASVNANNEKRDNHLKSSDFLNAEKYPGILFTSREIKDVESDGEFVILGDLTINGVTKPVELEAKLGGVVEKDPWGNKRSAFTATGEINRKDFGIQYNKLMETGGLVIGDEVVIVLEWKELKLRK